MSKLTHLDLFAGIAGFTYGFERAGLETVGFSEIDNLPNRVLARRYPGIRNEGDIHGMDGRDYRGVDIVTFGSPCQDFSLAGERRGLDGGKSGILREALRIVRDARPRLAIWENVPGALTSNKRWDFAAVLDALAELGAMDIAWRVLDAQFFGVPQRRKRVFLVADFAGFRAEKILFDSSRSPRPTRTVRAQGQEIAGTLGGGSGDRGWAPDTDRMTFIPVGTRNGEQKFIVEDESLPIAIHLTQDPIHGYIAPCMSAGNKQGCATIGVFDGVGVRRLTPLECERLQGFPDGWTDVDGAKDNKRYKALGNAVSPAQTTWLGEQVAHAL